MNIKYYFKTVQDNQVNLASETFGSFWIWPDPPPDTVTRHWGWGGGGGGGQNISYSCHRSRQTLTLPSDNVLSLMTIAHARFL